MRVMAVDHGTARAGCAISDPSGTIVRPLHAIEPPDPDDVARLAIEQGAELVVVGVPVSLSGVEGAQAATARAFAARVAERLEVPVELYDERLTTRMATATARGGAVAEPDALAAAHLLESYLQARERAESARSEPKPDVGRAEDLSRPGGSERSPDADRAKEPPDG